MGISFSRRTIALIATVVIVAVGLLVFLRPRPKVAAAGPAGIAAACGPGSRTGHADLYDNLQTSDTLTIAVRTPSDYDPTRAYPLLVVFPPAGYNRRGSEIFYDLTTEATRRGFIVCPSCDLVDTGLSGLALCLFGGDIPEGGMEPLTIVVSFDVGEQVVPGGIPGFVASLVHEFGFQSAEAAFHRCVVPTISLPAHGLDHPGCVVNLAVTGSGVLAAAIGMVSEAGRRLLPLDGHGQGRDGQFRPHVVTHRPADDFAGEEIEHDGQIEPPFPGWHVGDVGEPNLIGPLGGEFLVEPVGGDRQVVMAVRGAHQKPPWRSCPDAVMMHEAFDAATARRLPIGAQGRVDPGRAISSPMCRMDPPDLGQQGAIGHLTRAFGPATPGVIPRRRDTHRIAHDANRERIALILDEAEFHLGASEKMRSVFLRNSNLLRHADLLQDVTKGLRPSLQIGQDSATVALLVVGRAGIAVVHAIA